MTAPKEHGILFTDAMVRALRSGQKTVTRRTSDVWGKRKVGDLLWVRECFAGDLGAVVGLDSMVMYRADGNAPPGQKWKPGIHMPRWASRMTLRVTDVRREHCARGLVTHRWADFGAPRPDARAVWLYGNPVCGPVRGEVPGYARAPWPFHPLPWVDDAEAVREGVEDRDAYLKLFEEINGADHPVWVWRIAFEVTP